MDKVELKLNELLENRSTVKPLCQLPRTMTRESATISCHFQINALRSLSLLHLRGTRSNAQQLLLSACVERSRFVSLHSIKLSSLLIAFQTDTIARVHGNRAKFNSQGHVKLYGLVTCWSPAPLRLFPIGVAKRPSCSRHRFVPYFAFLSHGSSRFFYLATRPSYDSPCYILFTAASIATVPSLRISTLPGLNRRS